MRSGTLNGFSMLLPPGTYFVLEPSGVVTVGSPPLIAMLKLFTMMTVMSMFLLAACSVWLSPMLRRSASPLMTTTLSSGFASLTPIAKAMGLPCVVCIESKPMKPATLPVQPMPETTTSFLGSSLPSLTSSSTACMKTFIVVPAPQPGQRVWGSARVLAYLPTGCSFASLSLTASSQLLPFSSTTATLHHPLGF